MNKFNYRKIIPIFLGLLFTMVATVVLMIFIHETQTSSVRRSGEISCFTDGVFKCGNLRASNEEIIKEMNYLGLSPEETKGLMLEAQKDVKTRITELESKTNLTKKEKDLKDRLELSEIYYENALEALGVNVEGKDERIQIDTSDWKTYKNEDYGFELKYSDEWFIDEDMVEKCLKQNGRCGDLQKNAIVLRNKKTLEELRNHPGRELGPGASDYNQIRIEVFKNPKKLKAEDWYKENSEMYKRSLRESKGRVYYEIGSVRISEKDTFYVSEYGTYRVYFERDDFIVRFTTGSSVGGEVLFTEETMNDYFMDILNTFRFK